MDTIFKEPSKYFICDIMDVIFEIDIQTEKVLMELGETADKDEVDSINILREKFISKVQEIKTLNLSLSDNSKFKNLVFIKNSSKFQEPAKSFSNKLGYLLIFNQDFENKTIKQLKEILTEKKDILEEELDSFQELIKMEIFINLIRNDPTNLFIDLSDPSLNVLEGIKLNSHKFQFHSDDLEFLPSFVNLDSIRAVFIRDEAIKSLPSSTFTYFKRITELVIKDCKNLKEINPHNFQGLENLTLLSITKNGIERIYDNAFSTLGNLRTLELNGNEIEKIDLFAFNDLVNLENLNLNFNKIKQIKTDNFKPLKNLKYLNIFDNDIEKLESGFFNDLKNLESLKIDSINFDENNPRLLETSNLKFLHLATCLIPFEIDINFPMLEIIDLTRIQTTKDQINLIALIAENLKILACDFEEVPKFGENFKNLKALVIHGVCCFENECFENVKNLNFLKIKFRYAEAIDSMNEDTLKYFSNFKYFEFYIIRDYKLAEDYFETKVLFLKYFLLSLFNPIDKIIHTYDYGDPYYKEIICVKEYFYIDDYLNFLGIPAEIQTRISL